MDAAAAEGDAARFPEDEEYTERPQNTLPFPSISRQGSVEIDINEKKIASGGSCGGPPFGGCAACTRWHRRPYGPPLPPGATYAPAQGACTPFARGYAPRPRPLPYFCSAQNTATLPAQAR